MALKSSREGLRKELVDYLGNIIIDENLKQNIINSIDDVFIDNEELTTSVNELDEKIRNETSARESSDTTLQKNINAETLARESSDTTLQENINAETSARESADSNLESNKVNKSDVLSLEEILASTDLSGKIASANGLKTVFYAIGESRYMPYSLSGKDNIINNCKYVSSLIDPFNPRMLVTNHNGRGFVIGYTYERSENTQYAQYLYYYTGYTGLFLVNCFNGTWTVVEFSGVVL